MPGPQTQHKGALTYHYLVAYLTAPSRTKPSRNPLPAANQPGWANQPGSETTQVRKPRRFANLPGSRQRRPIASSLVCAFGEPNRVTTRAGPPSAEPPLAPSRAGCDDLGPTCGDDRRPHRAPRLDACTIGRPFLQLRSREHGGIKPAQRGPQHARGQSAETHELSIQSAHGST